MHITYIIRNGLNGNTVHCNFCCSMVEIKKFSFSVLKEIHSFKSHFYFFRCGYPIVLFHQHFFQLTILLSPWHLCQKLSGSSILFHWSICHPCASTTMSSLLYLYNKTWNQVTMVLQLYSFSNLFWLSLLPNKSPYKF